jgi:hypothetical protein
MTAAYAGGQECSTETAMLALAWPIRQSAGGVAVSFPITPEQIGRRALLIAGADFTALAAPPFTGVCSRLLWRRHPSGAVGVVTRVSCQSRVQPRRGPDNEFRDGGEVPVEELAVGFRPPRRVCESG